MPQNVDTHAQNYLQGVDYVFFPTPDCTDPNGHGTMVAGVAMSRDFGVARMATAIEVRVIAADGSGTEE